MANSKERPRFLSGIDVLISSSYRKHLEQVKQASFSLSRLGFNVYPKHDAQPVNPGEDFINLTGITEGISKVWIERHFLERIRQTKFIYVVATNGYCGQSASIETAYALAVGKPVILSESVTNFAPEVPQVIVDIIVQANLPEVPIQKLYLLKSDGVQAINDSIALSDKQRRRLFFSVLNLMKQLKSSDGYTPLISKQ